jgi:hypothetical protein
MRQDRGGAADAKDRDEGGSHPGTRGAAETANIDNRAEMGGGQSAARQGDVEPWEEQEQQRWWRRGGC